MTLQEFRKILETSGLPVTYRAWPENEAPPLPYLCYYDSGSNNFAADGVVYFSARRITVELYTELKDVVAESRVEQALSPFYWEKTEEYIDSEKCYQIAYEMEV